MSRFKVTDIVDPGTFIVSPSWNWQGDVGQRIRVTGYNCPGCDSPIYKSALRRLKNLIKGKHVELRHAYRVEKERLVCDVYLNGINLADYFPEFK